MSMRSFWSSFVSVALFVALLCQPLPLWAWQINGFNQGAVGGISISTDGVLAQQIPKDLEALRNFLKDEGKNAAAELKEPVELRMISLKAVNEVLQKAARKEVNDLPEEIRYLAGIQRIKFIFVYPDQNDIVLAGPGEGWKVDANANIVGMTTGRPVLRVDDLLVAFQTTQNARRGGLSCSIDPTEEGRKNLDAFLAQQKQMNGGVKGGVEKALGKQAISLTGVPTSTRFARTLVASDYRMKRIAMNLEKSPLAALPSFVDMLVKSNAQIDNMMPRWWLACDYEPLAKGENGLAWEIRGRGVKCLTEDEVIGANGQVQGTGKANPVAQKWADLMTEKYDELSAKEPIFGELRNVMDMAVVAAVIAKEDLCGKASCDLAAFWNSEASVAHQEFSSPKWVSSQCSLMKRGKEWVITASGGVDVTSWQVASKTVDDKKVNEIRGQATPASRAGVAWNKK
jgi:hypothetical protein